MAILTYLDYDTFLSVWYWVLVIVAWSLACHYTMGVPFDLVARADRQGGQHAADCDQLALIHARRIVSVLRRGGPVLVALTMFILVSLATLGFWFGYQVAVAFFLILAPIALVSVLGARLSMRVLAAGLSGEPLRRMIARRRFWDQVIGVCAISVTALAAGWHAVAADFQALNGITLGQALFKVLADWF